MIDTTSNKDQRFLSCLFPLIQYHSRWNELSINDFIYALRNDRWHYAGGYNFDSGMRSSVVSVEQMNAEAAILDENDTEQLITYNKGKRKESSKEDIVYHNDISEENQEWLRKIHVLCEKKSAQLVLIKIPSVKSVTTQSSSWTARRSEEVKLAAEQFGLPFIDYLYDVNIGIDLITDTVDEVRI